MEYKIVNTFYTFDDDYIVKETHIIITEHIKYSDNLREMAICLSAGLPYKKMEPFEQAYEEIKDELLFK